jgi:hypothetical protein
MHSLQTSSAALLETLRMLDGFPITEAAPAVREKLEALALDDHVLVVITFNGKAFLNLEHTTDFGGQVLLELASAPDFPPCPPGTCEPLSSGACQWCGKRV